MSRPVLVSFNDNTQLIRRIAEKLGGVASEAYVFGSFAEASAIKGESDFDLLVVPRRWLTYERLWRILDEEITAILELGLAPHLLISHGSQMRRLLTEIRAKGLRIL